jgi:hypothetical protein
LYIHDKLQIFVYTTVDDSLVTSPNLEVTLNMIKSLLDKDKGGFTGTSGPANHFVGMKLSWQPDGTVIVSQQAHIERALEQFQPEGELLRSLPMQPSIKLQKEGEKLNSEESPFASLVGMLLYIAVNSRPDISATVNRLAKYMSCPTVEHWEAAMDLLGYLRVTKESGLHMGTSDDIVAYCDADYASDVDTRRSHTGWVFLVYGCAVVWQSKCQPTVATSTVEAEYQATASATREALWMRYLLSEFGIQCTPLDIMCDSQGAIQSMNNPKNTSRVKHIDIAHHFVRERKERGEVRFHFVPGKQNVADVLTKPLPNPRHREICKQLGLVQMSDKRKLQRERRNK